MSQEQESILASHLLHSSSDSSADDLNDLARFIQLARETKTRFTTLYIKKIFRVLLTYQ
ncbi:hypothetical protein K7432_007314 [Basidiobolus ranarum]|uniref:Uncharacterized protein n=1 Tax=Basidiobolus ranarum TaxID=34480 RepID=A0ABR2W175_9FUNG